MLDTYYIAHNSTLSGTCYMLIVRDTHFCVSCGSDLEKIVQCLKRSVKRNRRKERLLRELSGLECGGRVSPATFAQREEWYRAHGEDYADLVHSTVVEALREAREEDKENSPLRKTAIRLKKAGGVKTIENCIKETTKEDYSTPQDSPKILRKPRVFKHK